MTTQIALRAWSAVNLLSPTCTRWIGALICVVAVEAWAGPTVKVGSIDAMNDALKKLEPGTTVVVANGVYNTTKLLRLEGKRGTPEAPIVVRAENCGKAEIGGVAGFLVRDCENVVLEGFLFTHDADQQSFRLENSRHVRMTRNTFRLSERAKPRHWEHWVTVDGARSGENRIDHNLFERKKNRGSPVFIRGDDVALVCSQKDRIDRNHFRDVVFANGENGHETIRTGGNDLGAAGKSSFTIIEENLLEHCSGEDELMSLKSSDNIVRNNTLLNCRGAICMRLGNRSVVSGNFIFATEGGPGCGGVKLFGFEHRVFNNYFVGLTGTRHEAPLALVPGMYDTPATDNIGKKYEDDTAMPPTKCWIAFNTWIDCAPLVFGFPKEDKKWKLLPNDCTFTNNLVVHAKPQKTPLVNLGLIRDLKAHDNLAYSGGPTPSDAWAGWFRWEDPLLGSAENERGLYRLTASSPVIDVAIESPFAIDDDVFGRVRNARRDIGAEEFSNDTAVRGPLTAENVGPFAP